jgi:hypothetical protein
MSNFPPSAAMRSLSPRRPDPWAQRALGGAHFERQGNEALLRAVVQVALDAPAGLVGGGDAGARGDELGTAVGAGPRSAASDLATVDVQDLPGDEG